MVYQMRAVYLKHQENSFHSKKVNAIIYLQFITVFDYKFFYNGYGHKWKEKEISVVVH